MKIQTVMSDEKQEKSSIADFIIPQKVDAFGRSFMFEPDEQQADEVFRDAQLRQYFQAFPKSMGDPLAGYIALLEQRGFYLKTSVTGECAIFVRHRPTQQSRLIYDAFGNDDNEKA